MATTLEDAVYVLELHKERNGNREGYFVGEIVEETRGLALAYSAGEIVLCRAERTSKTLTLDRPLSIEAIDEEVARGSLITTIGTMVGVPRRYVREVDVSDYFS